MYAQCPVLVACDCNTLKRACMPRHPPPPAPALTLPEPHPPSPVVQPAAPAADGGVTATFGAHARPERCVCRQESQQYSERTQMSVGQCFTLLAAAGGNISVSVSVCHPLLITLTAPCLMERWAWAWLRSSNYDTLKMHT
jgi:hypothetical protein